MKKIKNKAKKKVKLKKEKRPICFIIWSNSIPTKNTVNSEI